MKNNVRYLLDVDGTLTPSRRRIDDEFAAWLFTFCERNFVYLVTGSDKEKTVEQIGRDLYRKFERVYQCNGNDVWKDDVHIRENHIEYDADLEDALATQLALSKFILRTGRHIEKRPGLINFSTVGRNATLGERQFYVKYDTEHKERHTIAEHLTKNFPKYNFQVAGDTGIDITLKGRGKEQVLTDFEKSDMILFIGDKCKQGGNDYDIALAVKERSEGKNSFAYGPGKYYNVEDWKDTWEILKTSELE